MSTTSMTAAELERLLDIYGGDRTRWPAEARGPAAQLVARDRQARRLLAEAEALDRALERAPLPPLSAEAALADRVVAAAQRSPRMVRLDQAAPSGSGDKPAKVQIAAPLGQPAGGPLRRLGADVGRAAGLLAASLAVGVFIGLSSLPSRVLPALEDMTGITLGSGTVVAQIDPFDEDLL